HAAQFFFGAVGLQAIVERVGQRLAVDVAQQGQAQQLRLGAVQDRLGVLGWLAPVQGGDIDVEDESLTQPGTVQDQVVARDRLLFRHVHIGHGQRQGRRRRAQAGGGRGQRGEGARRVAPGAEGSPAGAGRGGGKGGGAGGRA